MRSDKDKVALIQEAVDTWKSGHLSAGAALVAINHYLSPKLIPTKEMIEHARTLQPLARKVLEREVLKKHRLWHSKKAKVKHE